MIIPNIWDNKKCSKPPTSHVFTISRNLCPSLTCSASSEFLRWLIWRCHEMSIWHAFSLLNALLLTLVTRLATEQTWRVQTKYGCGRKLLRKKVSCHDIVCPKLLKSSRAFDMIRCKICIWVCDNMDVSEIQVPLVIIHVQRNFHEINHPAIKGYPHDPHGYTETPICCAAFQSCSIVGLWTLAISISFSWPVWRYRHVQCPMYEHFKDHKNITLNIRIQTSWNISFNHLHTLHQTKSLCWDWTRKQSNTCRLGVHRSWHSTCLIKGSSHVLEDLTIATSSRCVVSVRPVHRPMQLAPGHHRKPPVFVIFWRFPEIGVPLNHRF